MNHSYRTVTCEVDETSAHQRYFAARLTSVCVEIDGKRIEAPYPNAQFEGATYSSAMLKATGAFREWLANFERRQQVAGF